MQVFDVGDFVCETKEVDRGHSETCYYRIVGAFQATKSFTGKWGNRKNEDIQRRGKSNNRMTLIFIKITS